MTLLLLNFSDCCWILHRNAMWNLLFQLYLRPVMLLLDQLMTIIIGLNLLGNILFLLCI